MSDYFTWAITIANDLKKCWKAKRSKDHWNETETGAHNDMSRNGSKIV